MQQRNTPFTYGAEYHQTSVFLQLSVHGTPNSYITPCELNLAVEEYVPSFPQAAAASDTYNLCLRHRSTNLDSYQSYISYITYIMIRCTITRLTGFIKSLKKLLPDGCWYNFLPALPLCTHHFRSDRVP